MPRPRSLTHAQLASAALAVIDRDGLPGLSMRAVGQELGVSTMALYRYVDDREELERLVVELVLSAVDTESPAPIEGMVARLRDVMAAHPAVLPLTIAHRHTTRSGLRWSEAVLRILTEAGIEGERRVIALRGLIGYVTGAIQLEHLGPLAGEGTVAISELPAEEFPYMAETARQAGRVSADREFFGGLDLLLRGLGL